MLDVDLMTFGYFEHVVLMIGWVVNNAIWGMLNESMMVALPFVALVLREWYLARREGEDEGNKGMLTLNRIEAGLYAMLLIFGFCAFPLMTINFQTGEYDESHWETCGTHVYEPGSSGTGSIGGKTAKAPIWWAFVHAMSHGATNAAVASLPCTPDYQYISNQLDGTRIQDPGLRRQLNEFQQWCFGLARQTFFRDNNLGGQGLTVDQALDADWIGSQYFLSTPGYYDQFYANKPKSGFPYDPGRDAGRAGTGPGQNGYPTCKEWWEAPNVGLKARLAGQVEPAAWDHINSTFGAGNAEDAAIRRVLAANPRPSQSSVVDHGSGDGAGGVAGDIASWMAGMFGLGATSLAAAPMKDIMVEALPMVQWLTLTAIVIALPFLIVFSGYSWKVAGTITFITFGTIFMTFWWELATWLDNHLTDILYQGNMDAWLAGATSGKERAVMWFVNLAMYLVLPALWMGMLGWAGYKGGGYASDAIRGGQHQASEAGKQGGEKAKSKATKGKL